MAMTDSWADVRVRADFLVNMSASADVLAQAKVEIDLAAIPEGKNVCLSKFSSTDKTQPYAQFWPLLCQSKPIRSRISIDGFSNRSLSNGAASQSSSVIGLGMRSKKPKTRNGNHCEIHNPIAIESRSQNG